MTDEELLKSYRGGNLQACDTLLVRYKSKVLSIAHKFFLVGGDSEDLVQEGMCGLYSAVTSFTGDSGFSSYAYTCIKNRILDAVKKADSNKNLALNGSTPYGESGEPVDGNGFNPEELLIISETSGEFNELLKRSLSPFEYKALRMYADGATMTEIAKGLNKTYKQTDNALSRAKQKAKIVFGKKYRE